MLTTISAATIKSNTLHVFHAGDSRVRLTTDGGPGFLPPARIRELILRHESLEEAARALTDAALAQGSDDNLSALLLAVDHLPLETLEET